MEILLLLMLVVLSIVAYKLHRLEKAQILSANAKLNLTLSTSPNPLFSEEEIASQRNLSEKWQAKVEFYFNLLQRTEKEEIEKHQSSGKDKSEFKPSVKLRDIILRESVAITGRNTTEARARQMIEANISILNGKSIAEVSEQFYRQQDHMPWKNTNLDADAWSNDPDIRKEFEKDLMTRSEFWQNSWNYILEKDYLTKE
jgi:hypothetical protein